MLKVSDAQLQTSEVYRKAQVYYNNLKEKIKNVEGNHHCRGPLIVLDLFSGIGSGVVVLKRLGIAMKTVILCEIDKVGNHVTRFNNDINFNPKLENDGIEYVYKYDTFEKVVQNIDEILRMYGPIDLIMGGPPCQDYAVINATRDGLEGESGKYLLNYSDLITTIQKNSLQKGKYLFYLAENVLFDKKTRFDIKDLFSGMPAIRFDASDFSPCKRMRNYWTNLPITFPDEEVDWVQMQSSPILENGFEMLGNLNKDIYDHVSVKANTFLASESRINDIRMVTVKKSESGKYISGVYTVHDRENMMGFPREYVSEPLKILFSNLDECIGKEAEPGASWYGILHKNHTEFLDCLIRIGNTEEGANLIFETKIGEPSAHRKTQPIFNCEDYAKHLIGNAWSIPVVEHLLKPLQNVCTQRRYQNYEYEYQWLKFND